VNQRPIQTVQVYIPSRSHVWFSIRVRGCKAFVTHRDCAPQTTTGRRRQVSGAKNLPRQTKSRAVFARVGKVYRAGCLDRIDRTAQV